MEINVFYVEERVKQSIFKNPYICSVTYLKDGTLAAVSCGQNPHVDDHYSGVAYLMISEDKGHTWTKRSIIAESIELPHGYTGDGHEVSMTVTQDDVLICAMRMDMSIIKEPYGTAVAFSNDNGYTWSMPTIISDASVTPHVISLDNGVIALVYGRPGVHFKYSVDNGKTWSKSYSIIEKLWRSIEKRDIKI